MGAIQSQVPETVACEQLNKLRELGFYERFRVAVHDLGFHYNISLVARYSHQGHPEEETRNLVFSAFKTAIETHPALGVVVVQTDTPNPFFARLGRINLSQAITFRNLPPRDPEGSSSLESFLAEENSRGFDRDNQPLWRAVVLEESQSQGERTFSIAFIWHHVIGDGRSGLAVHSTLLDAMRSYRQHSEDALSAKTTEDWWVQTSINPLLPPMERILSLHETTKSSDTKSLPAATKNVPQGKVGTMKWSGGHYSYQHPILTGIRCIRVPEANVQRLVAGCRRECTTVTALLQAVVGKALFDITATDLIRGACAISLRRFFPSAHRVDDSVMGVWISAFCDDYSQTDFLDSNHLSTIWERARHNTQRINFEIEKGDNDIDIAALRHIDDFKQSLVEKEGSDRENSFGLTNLGVFPSVRRSGVPCWDISDLVFSQSCHANGSAIQICIVTLEDGDMNIVFNWQRGIITDGFADDVAGAVLAELMGLSSEKGLQAC